MNRMDLLAPMVLAKPKKEYGRSKRDGLLRLDRRGKAVIITHTITKERWVTSIDYLKRLCFGKMNFLYPDKTTPIQEKSINKGLNLGLPQEVKP